MSMNGNGEIVRGIGGNPSLRGFYDKLRVVVMTDVGVYGNVMDLEQAQMYAEYGLLLKLPAGASASSRVVAYPNPSSEFGYTATNIVSFTLDISAGLGVFDTVQKVSEAVNTEMELRGFNHSPQALNQGQDQGQAAGEENNEGKLFVYGRSNTILRIFNMLGEEIDGNAYFNQGSGLGSSQEGSEIPVDMMQEILDGLGEDGTQGSMLGKMLGISPEGEVRLKEEIERRRALGVSPDSILEQMYAISVADRMVLEGLDIPLIESELRSIPNREPLEWILIRIQNSNVTVSGDGRLLADHSFMVSYVSGPGIIEKLIIKDAIEHLIADKMKQSIPGLVSGGGGGGSYLSPFTPQQINSILHVLQGNGLGNTIDTYGNEYEASNFHRDLSRLVLSKYNVSYIVCPPSMNMPLWLSSIAPKTYEEHMLDGVGVGAGSRGLDA